MFFSTLTVAKQNETNTTLSRKQHLLLGICWCADSRYFLASK